MRKFKVKENVVYFATEIFTQGQIIELVDVYKVDKNGLKFPLTK